MKYLEKEKLSDLVSKGVHLVDFYAPWCGPCKMMEGVLENIDSKINIIKVNIDEHDVLAAENNVFSVPSLIFIKDGKEVKRLIGYTSEDELVKVINDIKSE